MSVHASRLRALLLTVLLVWLGPAQAASPVNTGFFGTTAVKGYDVVAYHTEHKAVKGSSDYRHDWMGATWQFSSAENLARFQADPARYAPQYGGYCAFAVAKNDLVGIDPDAFALVGDKLYLNYSKKIQKEWEADRDAYIRKADANWPQLIK